MGNRIREYLQRNRISTGAFAKTKIKYGGDVSISDVARQAMNAELKEAIERLQALGEKFTVRQRKRILRKGAVIIRDAARANIPTSKKPHHVYDTPKFSNKLKAPKGEGRIVATYYPGNLKAAIQVKSLRRSLDIFVGPVIVRTAGVSLFGVGDVETKKSNVSGYYAHWMEFGNSQMKGIGYMRRAVESGKEQAVKVIVEESRKTYDRIIKEITKT